MTTAKQPPATIYLEGLSSKQQFVINSKLPYNQVFKKTIKQRNSPQITTQQTKVIRNTLSQKPHDAVKGQK